MFKLSEKTEHLSKCPLFETIPYDELKVIAFSSNEFSYKEGAIIFEEGDEALEAFIIFKGEVQVYKKTSESKEEILAELGENDIFGEFGIISSCPRSAGIRVTKDLFGIKIDKETFVDIIKEFPEVSIRIMDVLVQRIIRTEKRLMEVLEKEK